jgi:hypothetical protein
MGDGQRQSTLKKKLRGERTKMNSIVAFQDCWSRATVVD